jgi:hypothetical protein
MSVVYKITEFPELQRSEMFDFSKAFSLCKIRYQTKINFIDPMIFTIIMSYNEKHFAPPELLKPLCDICYRHDAPPELY